MKKKKTKLGIWGFGTTGKAAINYFSQYDYQLQVMDTKILSKNEHNFLKKHRVSYISQENNDSFFSCNEFLFSSPGIDISKYYTTYQQKWLLELDLFYCNFNKPIIAVTGSTGKTSVTQLLSQLLVRYGLNICIGGNIGPPTFDLLNQKKLVNAALLEVSSFQLEYCKKFAPDLAVWTNFYPNHLDRHGSVDNYFAAKYLLLSHQHSQQKALLPFNLLQTIKKYGLRSKHSSFFADYRPTRTQLQCLRPNDHLFFIDHTLIIKYMNGTYRPLIEIDKLPLITFRQNWLIICSILDMLALPLASFPAFAQQLTLPEHRLEKIASLNEIDFYNDSKSTTIASTYAAVQKLCTKSILLFLGGLSKNIDRTPLIKTLKGKVVYIYCFGTEAVFLNHLCMKYGIPSAAYATLNNALFAAVKKAKPGSVILFSPAGSSFDLFNNYQERGNYFKKLVNNYIINQDKIMK